MIEIPNTSQRQLVLGKTGSGKTRAAVWNLSMRNLNYMPWIVLNHKGEQLIDNVPGARHLDLNETPKKPGLYVYHPIPEIDDDRVTSLLWRVHGKEYTGIYIDEGYMVDRRDPAMQAILTQGRSKHIPMIILSQRPVWLTRFAVSEADFFQVFKLTDREDRDRIKSFIPVDLEAYMATKANEDSALPRFHSIWYDVGRNDLAILQPVPGDDIILQRLEDQLAPSKQNGRKIVLI
jgi:hypothetical protein